MYCTLWEECKQTQCPHSSWRERTKALMLYYSPTKKVRANTYDFWLSGQYEIYNSNRFLFHPLDPFSSKRMRCPEFFVLISSHCSTRIWRMRYGGSWSICFLVDNYYWTNKQTNPPPFLKNMFTSKIPISLQFIGFEFIICFDHRVSQKY